MLLDLAGVGGASQGSYLAAQIGSEIAGTGIQTVGGQERARAAGADGGRSCPACGGGRDTQTAQNLHAGDGGSLCLLPVCPMGSPDSETFLAMTLPYASV